MDPRAFPLPGWHHIWVWDAQRVQQTARRRQTKGHETAFSAKKGFRATPRATGNSGQRGRKARSFAPNGLGPRLFQHSPSFSEKHRGHNARGWAGAGQGGSVFKKRPCESCLGGQFWPPLLVKRCPRGPPIPANGVPYRPTRVPIAWLASNLGPRTRGESDGPRGATKRRAAKRLFLPKRGFAQHPVQSGIRCFGEKYRGHNARGRASARQGGSVFQKRPPRHVHGGGRFGPPFSAKGCARDPPIPANGVLYRPTLVPIPRPTSNLGPRRAASPTDRAAPQNEGPRNGVFGQKGGSRNTPCNREFGPKGFEKRDLLHQMGSRPQRQGQGERPPRGVGFPKTTPRGMFTGGSFWTPLFGQRLRARPPHTCQRGAL